MINIVYGEPFWLALWHFFLIPGPHCQRATKATSQELAPFNCEMTIKKSFKKRTTQFKNNEVILQQDNRFKTWTKRFRTSQFSLWGFSCCPCGRSQPLHTRWPSNDTSNFSWVCFLCTWGGFHNFIFFSNFVFPSLFLVDHLDF